MPTGVTAVIVPPATVNGPLPVGELAGPYLAADIAARAARARGERVVTTAGVDVHQNSVLTRAEHEGVDVEKLAAAYRDEIVDTLDAARIRYDVFLDPLSEAYRRGVTTLAADLTQAGRFPMRKVMLPACSDCDRTFHHSYVVGTCVCCGSEAVGGRCRGCGGYTSAANLIDARCNRCGGQPRPFQAKVPVLSMEDYRQELIEIWLRAALPDRARRLITYYLERRLPDVPIAYPTNCGLPGTGPHEGLRLDVYAELGLSTLYGVAQSIRPGAIGLEETAQAWSDVGSLWQFNGIDHGFYATLFWPAIHLACGVPPEAFGGAHLTESSPHAIAAVDFLHGKDVDLARLYLAWNHPDRHPADFTRSTYRQFETYARPLLNGTSQPAALPEADLQRAAAALHPQAFDPPLATRAILTTNTPEAKTLLPILTGRNPLEAETFRP
jgi:methionyl-tRNA synthetase